MVPRVGDAAALHVLRISIPARLRCARARPGRRSAPCRSRRACCSQLQRLLAEFRAAGCGVASIARRMASSRVRASVSRLRGRGQRLLQVGQLVLELRHRHPVLPASTDPRPPLRTICDPGSGVITPSCRLASVTVYLPGTASGPLPPPRPPNDGLFLASAAAARRPATATAAAASTAAGTPRPQPPAASACSAAADPRSRDAGRASAGASMRRTTLPVASAIETMIAGASSSASARSCSGVG